MIILCGFKKTEQQKVIKKKTKPPPREPLPTEQLLQAPPNRHWPTLAVVPESQPSSSVTSNSTAVVRFCIIRCQIRNRCKATTVHHHHRPNTRTIPLVIRHRQLHINSITVLSLCFYFVESCAFVLVCEIIDENEMG
ncbi:unnamed protein product [Vicia faba]|uniref:Uncharacterized protein n=1 Tax=Vicia faba TaxID=3906 RepID=A0AAV1BB69_VICFA|nr:unnamed protein product [Vicia faba]